MINTFTLIIQTNGDICFLLKFSLISLALCKTQACTLVTEQAIIAILSSDEHGTL